MRRAGGRHKVAKWVLALSLAVTASTPSHAVQPRAASDGSSVAGTGTPLDHRLDKRPVHLAETGRPGSDAVPLPQIRGHFSRAIPLAQRVGG